MTTAIVLSCHGTVESTSDLPAFLSNIRRGRPTPPALVEEVKRRFEEIGGSPLMRITAAQAKALSARLGMRVVISGRLWHPYPKEVLATVAAEGVVKIVHLPLAPQSVHVYHAAMREAAVASPGIEIVEAPAWGAEPRLIDAFIESIDEVMAPLTEEERLNTPIILTAHSLPQRIVDAGDPYEKDFRQMAQIVADRIHSSGNKNTDIQVAFQSQGATNDVWLGPDLRTTFQKIAEAHKTGKLPTNHVVVAPIGFVADHVETLYDLDIEAKALAESLGLHLLRATSMNVRPAFIDALANVATAALTLTQERS